MAQQYSYIGKGSVWIKAPGGKRTKIGNVSALNITASEETKTLPDYENAGGGNLDSISRITDVTMEMTTSNISPENLAVALRGAITANAAATVTAESVTADLDGLVVLARLPDLGASMTVTGTGGTPTYVEDTDYTRTRAGIIPLSTGSITEALALEVSYSALADNVMEALVSSAKEYELTFEGLNEARSGSPVLVSAYKTKFSPSGTDLVGDDFGELTLTASLNKDETKAGAGVSQYFKARMAQLA